MKTKSISALLPSQPWHIEAIGPLGKLFICDAARRRVAHVGVSAATSVAEDDNNARAIVHCVNGFRELLEAAEAFSADPDGVSIDVTARFHEAINRAREVVL